VWYSSTVDKNEKDRRFFWENWEYFQDLEVYGLTNSTVTYLLSVKELLVWKWATGQVPIPPKYRKKLEELFRRLGKAGMSDKVL